VVSQREPYHIRRYPIQTVQCNDGGVVADRGESKPRSQRRKNPRWPSLERQLADAQVEPGSALEQLIRDNQDFTILGAHEAADTLGLPPWLRVHWRKAHPDEAYSAADPSGGYPRVLHRTLAWMLANQDLRTDS
jgi:hypothetical protein